MRKIVAFVCLFVDPKGFVSWELGVSQLFAYISLWKLQLTNCGILVLRVVLEVVCINLSDLPKLFRLILVDVECLLVQTMPGHVSPSLLVGTQDKQMFQSLVEPSKMIVNLELTPDLRQLLQLPEEWKVLSGILYRI